jgi:hypothetical protein
MLSSSAFTRSRLQFDISIFYIYIYAEIIMRIIWGSARVLRAGVTGSTQDRGSPPNPAAAGDNLGSFALYH